MITLDKSWLWLLWTSRGYDYSGQVVAMITLDKSWLWLLWTTDNSQSLEIRALELLAHTQPKCCLPPRRYFCHTYAYKENSAKAFVRIKMQHHYHLRLTYGPHAHPMSSLCHCLHTGLMKNMIVKVRYLIPSTFHSQSHTGQNMYSRMFENMFEDLKMEDTRCHCLVRDAYVNQHAHRKSYRCKYKTVYILQNVCVHQQPKDSL